MAVSKTIQSTEERSAAAHLKTVWRSEAFQKMEDKTFAKYPLAAAPATPSATAAAPNSEVRRFTQMRFEPTGLAVTEENVVGEL